MKTYLEYLLESDREYHFRIKSIEPLEEDEMDRLERVLRKYELRDITGPRKTIIQEHPMDFYNIQNAEVYIVDAVLGVPQSSYILQQELRENLGVTEGYLVVRGDNDPLEIETQRRNMDREIRDQVEKGEFRKAALLDTEPGYPESEYGVDGKELFGTEYNSKFLNTLAQVSATRENGIVEPKNGLFNWLEKDIDRDNEELKKANYDEKIVGPHIVVPWWKAKNVEDGDLEVRRSVEGNLDDDYEEKHVHYIDASGKRKTISSKSDRIRK